MLLSMHLVYSVLTMRSSCRRPANFWSVHGTCKHMSQHPKVEHVLLHPHLTFQDGSVLPLRTYYLHSITSFLL